MSEAPGHIRIVMLENQTLDGDYDLGARVSLRKNVAEGMSDTIALDPHGTFEIVTREQHPKLTGWVIFTIKPVD